MYCFSFIGSGFILPVTTNSTPQQAGISSFRFFKKCFQSHQGKMLLSSSNCCDQHSLMAMFVPYSSTNKRPVHYMLLTCSYMCVDSMEIQREVIDRTSKWVSSGFASLLLLMMLLLTTIDVLLLLYWQRFYIASYYE